MKKSKFIYCLLIAVPITIVLYLLQIHQEFIVFIVASIALIPLAKLIGDSTEQMGSHYGSTLGSLLNVTFGNATEIIISISAINASLFTFVKASITGSILGNILLIFGLSIIAGGIRHKEQYFNKENTGIQSSMLFLAIIVLAVPTILYTTIAFSSPSPSSYSPFQSVSPSSSLSLKYGTIEENTEIQFISELLAFILLSIYIAGLLFTFVTHRYLFISTTTAAVDGSNNLDKKQKIQREIKIKKKKQDFDDDRYTNHLLSKPCQLPQNLTAPTSTPSLSSPSIWTKKKSFMILSLSIVGVAIISEILVGSIEPIAKEFGLSQVFIGAVIVGLVGNAAEHSSAIMLSVRNKLDLSIGIATGSATQVALFVVPILVIIGFLMGKPFTLVFTLFEIVSLFLAAIILNWISRDGKSNWFEGLLLTAVFIVFAIGFLFID